jgi:glycerophosphoryl diester phosphodiesterase
LDGCLSEIAKGPSHTVAVFENLGQHVDRELINSLHRQRKEIYVWTVNDEPMMSDMIDLGVDNILTDEPAKLRRLLEEREKLNETERLLLAFRKLIEY